MTEKISIFVGNKLAELGLKPPSLTDGLLLADDPILHRHVKQRIRHRLEESGQPLRSSEVDAVLSNETSIYLIEEVELESVDFLIASEKLHKPVFEKILRNIAHLDFRSFASAQQSEISLYDPEVITPQVSWAVEQIFQNLPGFFESFEIMMQHDQAFEEEQTDIVRNIFIIGYLHGFLSEENQNLTTAKVFLAHAIRKSNSDEEKLKPYPAFLRRIVDKDESAQVSPRLEHLKNHWLQQLARRWLLLSRTDEASADTLSQSTRQQLDEHLPKDRRPAENSAVARKMDSLNKTRTTFQGEVGSSNGNADQGFNESAQIREELQLTVDVAQQQQSTIMHMRDILRLYQGNNQEVFHNGHQNTEKWLPFKVAAEPILQKLVLGFGLLNDSKNDDARFDSAVDTIVKSMIQSLANSGDAQHIRGMFGADFFNLAQVEQLCLLSFTALSFINRETSTSKLAIQILDRTVIPRLNQYFDLDRYKELSTENVPAFNFSTYDQRVYEDKSQHAKSVLGDLQPADELVGVDSAVFRQLLERNKQQLSGVSKIYSLFASLTSENWGEHTKPHTIILGEIFVMTAFISGHLNFNLSESLLTESLKTIFSEDPYLFLLKIAPIPLTLASGALLMGDKARKDFKKLLLSSSELKKDLKKFSKGGWRQIAMMLMLSTYALSSTFPLWQNQADELWDSAKDRWEELFDDDEVVEGEDSTDGMRNFWEDRNPEAVDANDLLDIEKVDWGEIAIEEDVYGKDPNAPIGFINTYVVSPIVAESEDQQYNTESNMTDFDALSNADDIIVNASGYVIRNDEIEFTLANGDTYIQPAAGADFVVKNGIVNGHNWFARFLETGKYLDKIIVVSKPDSPNNFFSNGELFNRYDYPDRYVASLTESHDEYFVVYKTNPDAANELNRYKLRLDENLVFWQTHAADREIALTVLEKENPAAAALYAQMLAEQNLFWANYDPQNNHEIDYLKMIDKQITAYTLFVKTNHVYSLKYKPKTNYAEKYPDVGVMLDVMALKKGGYYCLTAHLAAQEWFLSLGVPMDGLYGYHIYDDAGMARSRIGHVQTGIYGAVHDFTPSTPNPGEDLRALDFNKNTAVSGQLDTQAVEQPTIVDLLQKFANVDNLSLLILLLSTVGVGYSIKLGIQQAMGKTTKDDFDTVEQVKNILPDTELALRGLTSALLQLLNLIAEVDPSFPDSEDGSKDRRQILSQIVTESLILATKPSNTQAEISSSMSMNPEVLALLQLVGLGNGTLSENAREQVESLWQKLNSNQRQTKQLLQEVLGLLDSISTNFGKASEIKRKLVGKSVRKLQKQLMRTRKKENRIYGMYGAFLEKSHLAKDEKINELRKSITADYLAIHHQLEQQSNELQQLNTQAKLLPTNVKSLKKVLRFMLNHSTAHDIAHE